MSHDHLPVSIYEDSIHSPGNFITTKEFPTEAFDELANRAETGLERVGTLQEKPEELITLSEHKKEILMPDPDDESGQTTLGVTLQTDADPAVRTLTVFSSAYEYTSPDKPKVMVSVNSNGLMVTNYGTSASSYNNQPLDQETAVEALDQALTQLEARAATA